MSEFSQDVARLMHYYLRGQGRPKHAPSIEDIADELDVRPVTVYKYVEGENDIPLHKFIRLCRMSGKSFLPVLREVVRKAYRDVAVVELPRVANLDGRIEDELEALVIALGQTTGENIEARGDGYDADETARLREWFGRIIELAERGTQELATMEAKHGKK